MQNVLSLRPDRPRPQRVSLRPRAGAQILLFTGVRYCRDAERGTAAPERAPAPPSGAPLDAAEG